MRFPAKITSSCIWVALPVDWGLLHWLACGADGRAGGRAHGHVITKFSRMGGLLYFRTHGAPMRELRYNQLSFFGEFKKFVPYCWRFTTQASSTFLAFVILLLKPLRSFFFIFFFDIF